MLLEIKSPCPARLGLKVFLNSSDFYYHTQPTQNSRKVLYTPVLPMAHFIYLFVRSQGAKLTLAQVISAEFDISLTFEEVQL